MKYNLLTILGPTAVGKTRLAALLANYLNGEIISADSRQVYVGMDIGTGKDLKDYIVDEKQIQFYLIDIVHPNDEFNLFEFYKKFFEAFHIINSKNKLPILCGGTGLYLHSIIKDYNLSQVDFNNERIEQLNKYDYETLKEMLLKLQPKQHNKTDLVNKQRVIRAILIAEQNTRKEVNYKTKINSFNIGVFLEREEVKKRITERLKVRLQNGMIEEVQKLYNNGVTFERLEQFGLEYKFVAKYLKNEISYDEMFEKLNVAIHQFSKRQMTWFRKMEREGILIHWINGADFTKAVELIKKSFF
ncbi:MAG: tRNA (adenosine(37)-N6)-dimethylallyltransferase MiaA [Melioribacteraceae bacterium]|nr:tRNA (adenosine(37)-N6)-dimethylallyltransferase MiaA [Melioribacteraceae bacterium]